MPSLVTPSRRPRDESSDEEDDANTTPPSDSSRSGKRARHHLTNGTGSAIHKSYLTNGHRPQGQHAQPLANGDAPKAPLVHQPGSIVRVTLENFVTYDSGEFRPGPSLNMVIGPNGTGKSTLVCAICLGLGWGSQHLGRAKEVSEFVKIGKQEAMIEIELCRDGKKYKRNPVIRCIIKKEGNKSLYTLNGKSSNKKQVQEVARSFSIQIDNLCQFLPQDRVAEFANLSPVELLRSTQRAVASQEMIDWHEELIKMRQNQRDVETQNTADRETLTNLENRQRMQEADVQRLREREEIKERIRMLTAVKPVAIYKARLEDFDKAKQLKNDANRKLQDLEAAVEPTLRAVNAKQAYRDAVKAARDDRSKVEANGERQAQNKAEQIESLQHRVEEIDQQREKVINDGKKHRSDVKRLNGIIRDLQRQLDQGPGDFDVASCLEQLRAKERQERSLVDEATQIREKMHDLNRQGKDLNTQIAQAQNDLERLDSVAGQQEVKLSSIGPDTLKAWQWVQENQDQFEMPIFGPPVVECSIKDQNYADMIESLLQQGDLITFTAQTRNDQKKLHNIIKNQLKCARTNTRCAMPMSRFSAPVSDTQREALGFEGWALDYVQGPEPVLAMLCEAAALHRTGVTLEDTSAERFEQLQNNAAIPQWVTGQSVYRVMRRREYGPGAVSTTVRSVRKANIWTNQPVDMTMKQEIRQKIAQLEDELNTVKGRFAEHQTTINNIRDRSKEIKEELEQLRQEKETKQKAASSFNALPVRIAQSEDRRKEASDNLEHFRARLDGFQSNQNDLKLEKARAALKFADSVQAFQQAIEALQEAEIMLIEAQSDVETLERNNIDIKNQLEAKRREAIELEGIMKRVKAEAKKALADVNKLRAEADDALSEFLETFNTELTIDQLEGDIQAEEARLDLTHGGDNNIIAQFEDREKKIMKLRDRLGKIDGALLEISQKIAEVRAKWEPKLDALVKRISSSFSYNMAQIKCNGEVGIQKEEDFDQWAIEILVRFREHEPLTRLDAHRQSGGERAVSTVFYLMSLQSLTRSPFRVVDEINQGMDPRNERLVHARMVAIATGNDEWRPDVEEDTNMTGPGVNGAVEIDGEDDNDDDDDDDITVSRPRGRNGNRAVNGDTNGVDGEINTEIDKVQLSPPSQGSQYFLVTPKLLHDLRYEEGMTVLCIVSGEHLLDREKSIEEVDFRRSLEVRRRMNAAAAAGA